MEGVMLNIVERQSFILVYIAAVDSPDIAVVVVVGKPHFVPVVDELDSQAAADHMVVVVVDNLVVVRMVAVGHTRVVVPIVAPGCIVVVVLNCKPDIGSVLDMEMAENDYFEWDKELAVLGKLLMVALVEGCLIVLEQEQELHRVFALVEQ
jgi:hypothetical protein